MILLALAYGLYFYGNENGFAVIALLMVNTLNYNLKVVVIIFHSSVLHSGHQ